MRFVELCIIPVLQKPEAFEDPGRPFWWHNATTQNCPEAKNIAVIHTIWMDVQDMLLTVDKWPDACAPHLPRMKNGDARTFLTVLLWAINELICKKYLQWQVFDKYGPFPHSPPV